MFDKRKEKFVKEIQPQVANMPFHRGLLRSYDYYHTDLFAEYGHCRSL